MIRPCGIPSWQPACFSGHKSLYWLTHQSNKAPDDLVVYGNGLQGGPCHKITLQEQYYMSMTSKKSFFMNDMQLALYCHPGYMLKSWVQVEYGDETADVQKQAFNSATYFVKEVINWL